MKPPTRAEIDAAIAELERRGDIERGPDRDGKPTWLCKPGFCSEETKADFVAADKFVLEVRGGVVLYLNEPASPGESDGWWWGFDEVPTLHGPFASAELAVKDASAQSTKPLKVITHDNIETMEGFHTDGYVTINVVDTAGEVWVCVYEKPATGRVAS
jgi:hypothetical protein